MLLYFHYYTKYLCQYRRIYFNDYIEIAAYNANQDIIYTISTAYILVASALSEVIIDYLAKDSSDKNEFLAFVIVNIRWRRPSKILIQKK